MSSLSFPSLFAPFSVQLTLLRYSSSFLYQGQSFYGSYITLPADLIAGQTLSATINNITISQAYTASSANTLTLFADQIYATVPNIELAFVDNLIIGVSPTFPNIATITAASVTPSVPQPTFTNNPTSSLIYGCIQPVIGEELLTLPEGRRDQETYRLWSSIPIYTVNNSNETAPDRLQFYGNTYEVFQVKPWQSVPINSNLYHYNYFASRLQPLAS